MITTLHQASREGRIEDCTRLIAQQPPNKKKSLLDARDQFGFCALHWAVQGNHSACAVFLLDNGASVNKGDADGQTALHWAVDRESSGLVRLLLQRRANVNAQDSLKHSALHRASALGLTRIAKSLLDSGADVNLKNGHGWTPLHVATFYYHKEIVQLMLAPEYSADVELANKDGWTALHCAAAQGHADICQILISLSAAINARATDQSTPLHAAVRGGHARTVRLLVSHGAATSLKDAHGNTPAALLPLVPEDRRAKVEAALPAVAGASTRAAAVVDSVVATTADGATSSTGKSSPLVVSSTEATVPAAQRPSASNSVAVGDGVRGAVAGHPATFKVQVKNSRGRYVDRGGAPVAVHFRSGITQRVVHMKTEVSDNADGTYTVVYTPGTPGVYALEVTIGKRHVAGSPFTVRIVPPTNMSAFSSASVISTADLDGAASHDAGADGSLESSAFATPRGRLSPTFSPRPPLDLEAGEDLLRTRLVELDARHRRLLADHAAVLRQLKQQERAIRDDPSAPPKEADDAPPTRNESVVLKVLAIKGQQLAKTCATLTTETACVVCKTGKRDTVVLPCLHMQYCPSCAIKLTKCVTCGKEKNGTLRVHLN